MNVLNTSKFTKDINGMDVVRVITPNETYVVFDFQNNMSMEITIEKIDYVKPSSIFPHLQDDTYPYKDVLRCAELKAVVNGKTFMIEVSPLVNEKKYSVKYFKESWEDFEGSVPQELIDEMDVILYADYCTEDEHRMGVVNPV